jgi:hypothetical protein
MGTLHPRAPDVGLGSTTLRPLTVLALLVGPALLAAALLTPARVATAGGPPAASALWVRFGGARMVIDAAARYGLTGTAPPAVPGQWGEATTTARDLARFLARLPVTAHPADAATLQVWMRTAAPVAADGFDQRFGLFGTAPGRSAVKQGWMCCVGGNRHVHSVGVVGSRVVVLLSEVPRAVGYGSARPGPRSPRPRPPCPRPSGPDGRPPEPVSGSGGTAVRDRSGGQPGEADPLVDPRDVVVPRGEEDHVRGLTGVGDECRGHAGTQSAAPEPW